ncbi:MAG: hypothetical protein FWE80_07065 [Oscillospiraceae bacterium]|nr:hypothetical protein [Oscillospiraceae bacterium]
MQTTKLYVELVIIGLESFFCILLTILSIIRIEGAKKIISFFGNSSMSTAVSASIALIFLGSLYIMGVVFDRLADIVFQPLEKYYRKKSGLIVRSIMLLPFKKAQNDFMIYSRSRLRILRATIVNSLLTMVAGICFISLHIKENKIELLLFVIFFCLFVACVSLVSFAKLLVETYNKARDVEKNLTITYITGGPPP